MKRKYQKYEIILKPCIFCQESVSIYTLEEIHKSYYHHNISTLFDRDEVINIICKKCNLMMSDLNLIQLVNRWNREKTLLDDKE